MDLAQALLAHRPRESSGSVSANRLAFQRTWALCHLFELHETDRDYVLILEFHDDVLVLDSATTPTRAEFFQVKTRRGGPWRQRELTVAKERGAKSDSLTSNGQTGPLATTRPQSILGKLLEHCRHFMPQLESLSLVSNVSFDLPLSSAGKSSDRAKLCAAELTAEALREIEHAVQRDAGLAIDFPWTRVFLVTTDLSLVDHDTHGAGELAAFLERRSPGGRFAVQSLFRALSGELARRAECEWSPSSFAELCRKKGLSRAQFETFILGAEAQTDPEADLQRIAVQLQQEGLSFRESWKLKEAWRRYQVGVMNPADVGIQELREHILAVVRSVADDPGWETLREFTDLAERTFVARHGLPAPPFDVALIRGAVLYEFRSEKRRELSPPHPQSTGAAP